MSVRLDKWLWAARFFKTRSKARSAVVGGKVTVNGVRAKPAREVRPGDILTVTRGEDVSVVELILDGDRRGPAVTAQKMYAETPESIAARQALVDERRARGREKMGPERRPDKRQRRQIVEFTRKKDS